MMTKIRLVMRIWLWALLLISLVNVEAAGKPFEEEEEESNFPAPKRTKKPPSYTATPGNVTTSPPPLDSEGVSYYDGDKEISSTRSVHCRLRPVEKLLHDEIETILKYQAKLIYYDLSIVNHTNNPLLENIMWSYKLNQWTRVAHSHGQTILSLAFNYGILSLMTLSFGISAIPVKLEEQPYGCLRDLPEREKIQVVLDILLKDFNWNSETTVYEPDSVCHQMIKDEDGKAKFTDQCCFKRRSTGKLICLTDFPNQWLDILNKLLAAFSFIVFLFGPMMVTSALYSITQDTLRYVVKLKEPLFKTITVCRGEYNVDVMSQHTIDLRDEKTNFYKCKHMVRKLPSGMIVPIKISEFNIVTNYAKLLPENKVPVGVWQCLSRAIFMCQLKETDAFGDCCEANMCGCLREDEPLPWINLCQLVGRITLVLVAPFPFYIRLILYYIFEHPEIMQRREATERVGLSVWYDYRILQFLTPTHPIMIAIYVIYFSSGLALAYLSLSVKKSKFQEVLLDSIRDLYEMSFLSAMAMLVKNFLWPFKKLGLFGVFFGLFYWPLVMPISIIACCFYCVPLVFLITRLMMHSLGITPKRDVSMDRPLPGQMDRQLSGMQVFEADELINTVSGNHVQKFRFVKHAQRMCNPRSILNIFLASVCVITILAIMVMFAEVVLFILQVCVFTMMGIIVNAGKVLKYGSLIFLVVLYSYDCYNNVYIQYLKLNKALFSEIKHRIKDISEVTSLPSYLQENRGFKAAEASEQADYESTDDLSKEQKNTWIINDLILFIDNDDNPRIPKKLFEETCEIRVPGSPGPVYRNLLYATGKFCVIITFIVFVFIVVLMFGDVYKVSSTNQMLATMAGGFVPMVFSNVLKPATPPTELGSVTFKAKLEEIIINFWQPWPMFDFPMEIEEKPEEEEEGEKEEGDDKDSDKASQKTDRTGEGRSRSNSKGENGGPTDISKDVIELQNKLESMKTYRPAGGQYVDIIFLLPEAEDSDWLMDWSDHSQHLEQPLQLDDNFGYIDSPV